MAEKQKDVKIKALVNALGSEKAVIGDILEVPEEVAKKLIESGYAEKAPANAKVKD